MEQTLVFVVILLSLFFFVRGKVRYDIVAFLALAVLVLVGVIPSENAFTGLSHPAVITVAAVLIISKALQHSGLVDIIANWVGTISTKFWAQLVMLTTIVALASAFINNVGALAIIMPVALHLSKKYQFSVSRILMPIAFASILGGMITLIGTPPNIIISTFRSDVIGERFGMFDFFNVGGLLTLVGLLFIIILGFRFLPKRNSDSSKGELFEIESYITEVKVTEGSKIIGMPISKINEFSKTEILILGIIRNGIRIHAPQSWEELQLNDVLLIEADTDDLKTFLHNTECILAEGESDISKAKGSQDIETTETIVTSNSMLIGNSAKDFRIRSQYHINILAIARQNRKISKRISNIKIKPGDVLLLQGKPINTSEAMKVFQCLPLARRNLSLGKPRRVFGALAIFLITMLTVVLGFVPVEIAFSIAAVLMVLVNILPIKEVYLSVDWPVIILLAAMIPVGEAFESSGGAATITNVILNIDNNNPVWVFSGILMVTTILLSNVINNAATVVLMAPIAIKIATGLDLNPDPFLMTVAVGASCAFLTPIGHQSNTLVMGPGGYKFSDYWKMGLPLTLLIILIGVPLILYIWPA